MKFFSVVLNSEYNMLDNNQINDDLINLLKLCSKILLTLVVLSETMWYRLLCCCSCEMLLYDMLYLFVHGFYFD